MKNALDPSSLDIHALLREAAGKGEVSACDALIDQGANPNARDPKTGETALHRAVSGGDFETMWFLHSHARSMAKKAGVPGPDAKELVAIADKNGHSRMSDYLRQFANIPVAAPSIGAWRSARNADAVPAVTRAPAMKA